MISKRLLHILPIVLAAITQLASCVSAPVQDKIHLSLAGEGYWKVTYHLARPTPTITLARTPDNSRSGRWQIASPEFEIVQVNNKDLIRRIDGAAFSLVHILVPATYVPLPKDYAPFAPFSDGGLLIHSGRFHACPTNTAQANDDCDGPWLMQITSPPDAHILLNGRVHTRSARWVDSGDGTKVYVGTSKPRATSNFIGIVDPALPSAIAELMLELLPELMEQYGQKFPPLPQRPMLFVSYEPFFSEGRGRQGGTLPGQVFMHFYGPGWEVVNADGYTPEETAWFFAHEVGHLFQHGVTGVREASWIHEGAAEAFAYLMLGSLETLSEEYLATRRQSAFDGCHDALSDGTLASAADRGRFSDYYQCGLIMFLAIDAAIRANSDDQNDLFSFWTTLIADTGEDETWESENFLEKAQILIGPSLAERLRALIFNKQDDPAKALRKLEP